MSVISDVIQSGLHSAIPTLTSYHAGYLYFETDTHKLFRWSGSAWVQVAADSTITGYTDEQAQDAIGAMLADTDTIDMTYTDATPELKADVKKQMSITSDSSGLKLSGDSATPGNNKVYGTDGSGVKGWKADPSGGGGGGGLVFLGARTASNSALLLFDSLISGTYDKYRLEITDFIAQTNNVDLNIQYSVDNGSSYATGSDYYSGVFIIANGGGTGGGGGNPGTAFQLALGVINTSSRPLHGTINMQSFPSTALSKAIYGQTFYTNQSNVASAVVQGLLLIPGTAYNSFKIFFSSGNIVSGVARLYGVANS